MKKGLGTKKSSYWKLTGNVCNNIFREHLNTLLTPRRHLGRNLAVLVSFCISVAKMSNNNILEKEMVIWGLRFQRFQSIDSLLPCSGPKRRDNIVAEGPSGGRLLSSRQRQEAKGEGRRVGRGTLSGQTLSDPCPLATPHLLPVIS